MDVKVAEDVSTCYETKVKQNLTKASDASSVFCHQIMILESAARFMGIRLHPFGRSYVVHHAIRSVSVFGVVLY